MRLSIGVADEYRTIVALVFAPARQQKTWKPVHAKLVLDVLEDRFAPAVLLVGTASTEYHTIHSAVSAANSGDIVLVDPGTYQEQVTITKSIELMPHYGSNNGQTIIESPTNLAPRPLPTRMRSST